MSHTYRNYDKYSSRVMWEIPDILYSELYNKILISIFKYIIKLHVTFKCLDELKY